MRETPIPPSVLPPEEASLRGCVGTCIRRRSGQIDNVTLVERIINIILLPVHLVGAVLRGTENVLRGL